MNIIGIAELNKKGMELLETDVSGPYQIIDVDYNFGIEILDENRMGQWIMKGNYTILDEKTIDKEEIQRSLTTRKLNKFLKSLSSDELIFLTEKLNPYTDSRGAKTV